MVGSVYIYQYQISVYILYFLETLIIKAVSCRSSLTSVEVPISNPREFNSLPENIVVSFKILTVYLQKSAVNAQIYHEIKAQKCNQLVDRIPSSPLIELHSVTHLTVWCKVSKPQIVEVCC